MFYGHDVVINDLNRLTLERFPENLTRKQDELFQRELILDRSFLGKYRLEPELEAAVKDVDFVIEAIQENLGAKRAFFQRVSNACHPNTILATSTINLRLEDVFSLTVNSERTLGLRFLHPVYFVQDVEVRYHEKTSSDVKDKVARFVGEDLQKNIFLRSARESPLMLQQDAVKAMEEARREQLRRLRRDVSLTNSSIEAQRGSIPSLSVDCDDDVDCRQCNRSVVLGHGAVAASTPTVQFGFPSRYDPGPQPLRSIDTVTCPFCKLRPTRCVLSPCLHHICKECAKSLMNKGKSCPVQDCQRNIDSYQTIGGP